MKTKILFVIDSLGSGGTERQMVELIKGLDQNDYDIHLIVLKKGDVVYEDKLKELGVCVSFAPRRYQYDLSPLFFISNYIRKNRVQIVHAYLALGAFFGVIAAKIASKPVVCSAIRDATRLTNWKDYFCKRIESFLADAFIANNKTGLDRIFPKPRRNFRVIYNGVDLKRFEVSEEEIQRIRQEFKLERFDHLVGMVARFTEHKDYDTFVNCIPKVCKKFSKTGFFLIGDGPDRKRIEKKINQKKISPQVILTGYRPDIECLFRVMDISVLMTNHQILEEGISNSLLEAMISGVPVIASSGGGTLELIKDGETGFLVPPGDHKMLAERIIHLLNNKRLASEVASRGRDDVIRRFSLDRYVKEHTDIYEKLIHRR